jgi:uncharacterized protein (TIGR02466 family)
MTHFEEFGYEIVRNAISKDVASLLAYEFNTLRNNTFLSYNEPLENVGLSNDTQVEQSFAYYAMPGFEALLEILKPTIEKITGKILYPTYSYSRIYYKNAILAKHIDRPSCQYSATLTIDIDKTPWPIWINDYKNTPKSIILGIGDMCIYKGDELVHWREPYNEGKQIQVFLHYVEVDGKYSDFKFDKRESLGHRIEKTPTKLTNGDLQEVRPFYTNLYKTIISDDYSFFTSMAKSLQENSDSSLFSNRGGWQSPSYGLVDNVFFIPIINSIIDRLRKIYLNYGIDKDPELANYWININKKYDYNITHNHPNSYFSAVLYLKVPKNSGNIVFERPDDFTKFIFNDRITENSTGSYYIIPDNNLLLIFPSYLSHRVEQNLTEDTEDERISMAFNFR